ncbi:MAG: DUF1844 domain-containing protein [Phycisphaerae bacterium]|nr:DUF1844 domain-containing protein [Phycisphaerae bacterium]
MAEQEKDKKIIIDEDWKAEAQREKEQAEQQAQADEGEEGGAETGLPQPDFTGLVSMLATQAFFALGLIGREGEPQREPDFLLAKFHIDTLEVLEKKTQGNLTDDEKRTLSGTLGQLRMAFVQLAEKAS